MATWRDLAVLQPVFVQWVVQKHGPLPDGEVDPELVLAHLAEYMEGE